MAPARGMQKEGIMDWVASLKTAIDYMEEHLLTNISAEDVAGAVHISPFYFQKGFKIVTGYSIGEYLRNRRLYLAGLDVIQAKTESAQEKVIDLAYKYGYDTPESFSRAFSRFHGLSPAQLRLRPYQMQVFLPLSIKISIQGGDKMDFTVEKRDAMKMIGFERIVSYDSSQQEIPKFWHEFCEQYCGSGRFAGTEETHQTVAACQVGEFGICTMEKSDPNQFRYYIAGVYQGGAVPDSMKVIEIPASEWVKFKCIGPMPQALQTINARIWGEWLPGNQEFETALPINIEWYSTGDTNSSDYKSEIWIPVKRL